MITYISPNPVVVNNCRAPEVSILNGTPPIPDWHPRFLRMLPAIRRRATYSFRKADPATREEAIQEVVANVLVAYVQLVEREKEHVAFAASLAGYAIAQVRAGRRVGSRLNVRDVYDHGLGAAEVTEAFATAPLSDFDQRGAGYNRDANGDGVAGAQTDIGAYESQGVPSGFPDGDYNYDGIADIADYTVWRNTLGQTGPNFPANGDNVGASQDRIDEADYAFWRANFGNTIVPTTSGAGDASIEHLPSGADAVEAGRNEDGPAGIPLGSQISLTFSAPAKVAHMPDNSLNGESPQHHQYPSLVENRSSSLSHDDALLGWLALRHDSRRSEEESTFVHSKAADEAADIESESVDVAFEALAGRANVYGRLSLRPAQHVRSVR